MTVRVGINGFGRIGTPRHPRGAAGRAPTSTSSAINDLTDATTLGHLFKYDSVHGVYPGRPSRSRTTRWSSTASASASLSETDPAKLPWKELGADVVIESTGRFTERDDAAKHLEAGARRSSSRRPPRAPT